MSQVVWRNSYFQRSVIAIYGLSLSQSKLLPVTRHYLFTPSIDYSNGNSRFFDITELFKMLYTACSPMIGPRAISRYSVCYVYHHRALATGFTLTLGMDLDGFILKSKTCLLTSKIPAHKVHMMSHLTSQWSDLSNTTYPVFSSRGCINNTPSLIWYLLGSTDRPCTTY